MSDENTEVNVEEKSDEQELEEVIAFLEAEDDTAESDGEPGESDGTDGKPAGSDDGDGSDSGAGDEDGTGKEGGSEEEPPEKSDKEERLATRWSNLLKKENELRKDKKELKDLREQVGQLSGVIDKIKEDPTTAFDQLFSTDDYKKITLKKLGKEEKEEPETPKERVFRERLDKLEGDKKVEVETAEKTAEDEIIASYEGDIKTALDAAGEEFELMKVFPGAVQEARIFSELYATDFEKVLEPKEAIGTMEKHLRTQLKASLQTKIGRKMAAELLSAEDEGEESDDIEGKQKPTKKAKTVKNDLAASPAGVAENKSESINEDDMIADGVREFERVLALGEN